MNRLILFITFMFCLTFLNFTTHSQDHRLHSPPLPEDPFKDFFSEFDDEGIKYYIKIIPGDTTVGKNMPMYRPDKKGFTETQVKTVFENPKPIVKVQPNISDIKITNPVKVWVKCFVDKDGEVKSATILKSDMKSLNESALKAAKQWKFKPAVMNGKPLATYVAIPFEFKPKE